MICPECRAAGMMSTVTVGPTSQTAVYYPPFFDEQGRYHNHDANRTSGMAHCSRGHSWPFEIPLTSCWCGWPVTPDDRPT
jgi:hypothetical protein